MSANLMTMAPVAPILTARRGAVSAPQMSVFGLIEVWKERHALRCDLRRFDDHMLLDIGMSRADAEAEIAKPFWRR